MINTSTRKESNGSGDKSYFRMSFMCSFLYERMDQRPAYGFSHRIRAAVEKDQITPSPWDYHVEKVSLRSSKAFTFGCRPITNYVRDFDTPGPGEYFISEEAPIRGSGYSFGSKPAAYRSDHSLTPGPKYKPIEGGSFQPQRGFSIGYRSKWRRISATPGPGEYESKKFIFKQTPAYTFGNKNSMRGRSDLFRYNTPGPFDYQPEMNIKNSSPAFSFGTKARERAFEPKDLGTPGPGEYDTNKAGFKTSGKGFSFGLRVRRNFVFS